MPDLLARVAEKKAEFDRLRPLAPHGLGNLEHVHDLELTYSSNQPRYVLTDAGRRAFPLPAEVPALMGDLSAWLRAAPGTPATAFEVHRRLVDIHPFNDGNGRTARLLMDLLLLRGGYPPVSVRPQDRAAYVASLQEAQSGQGAQTFNRLLYERLDATLDEYITALNASLPKS